ncbi:integrase [Filomicrobium sp.]|uniref:integrase n=1 Tax=Filomicrobium sp. TaxID=2024831 RepID=UPI002586E851|nr:integrase [Filomicrobium sp.]MCV0369534.1 integrase [Filomicrobium sp.]
MDRLLPQKRSGIWYLVRRVPKAYQSVDKRRFAKMSTGIRVADDPRGARAARVLPELNEQLEEMWRDLAAGREPGHRKVFQRAVRMAGHYGLAYQTSEELATGPLEEIVRRIETLERTRTVDSPNVVDAVLGAIDKPDLMLSELFDAFKEEQAASVTDMSPGQLKRWETNKTRPLDTLVSVVGDKSVLALTREDGIAFRKYWQKRIKADEILITSANKEIGSISRMLRVVEREKQIGIPLHAFADLRIEGGRDRRRPAFEQDFIQNNILATGALDRLNDEARRVVYVCADTGMRPVEVVNLLPQNIHLDAKIPYVSVRPDGRRMKTQPSERDMPLVGCALEAMKLQPNGFPRYFDKGNSLSATVNKFLEENDLLPTDRHSLYSLRHSFEDRLTDLKIPEKIVATLMGHKQTREKYGEGPSLKLLQSVLSKIAFKPPNAL